MTIGITKFQCSRRRTSSVERDRINLIIKQAQFLIFLLSCIMLLAAVLVESIVGILGAIVGIILIILLDFFVRNGDD